MKTFHSFTIPVTPKPLQFSGKRIFVVAGKPRFFKDAKALAYQRDISFFCRRHLPDTPHACPLALTLTFVLPRPLKLKKSDSIAAVKRPDLDNLIKGTQDALSDFWRDDSQIVYLVALKSYATEGMAPCIGILIQDASNLFSDAQ